MYDVGWVHTWIMRLRKCLKKTANTYALKKLIVNYRSSERAKH
jgi:hypothetical protein